MNLRFKELLPVGGGKRQFLVFKGTHEIGKVEHYNPKKYVFMPSENTFLESDTISQILGFLDDLNKKRNH